MVVYGTQWLEGSLDSNIMAIPLTNKALSKGRCMHYIKDRTKEIFDDCFPCRLKTKSKNPNVDFIVMTTSNAAYGQLPDNDPNNPLAKLDADFRKFYHPLCTQYGVHLVVSSGLNNYQRTHVLGFNESNPVSSIPYLTSESSQLRYSSRS